MDTEQLETNLEKGQEHTPKNDFTLPSNLDKTIDFPEGIIALDIGDIVEFATKEYEQGWTKVSVKKGRLTTSFESGHLKMLPPAMVVIEVVRENHKKTTTHSEQTGKHVKDLVKVLCQWYSHKTGKFEETWFNISVLKKIKDIQIKDINLELNQAVVLKTNKVSNQTLETKLKMTVEEDFKVDYDITRTFETTSFLPPKMVITGIDKAKDPIILFDKHTGKRKRYASEIRVKCMWYNYLTGKFSEHYFIPHALMAPEKLDVDSIINTQNTDTP